jgi:hypothetical protein
MNKTVVTEEDIRDAQRLAEELRRKLPTRFVVKSRVKDSEGKPRFRDVVLNADPEIPGRFIGCVDITPPPASNGKNGDKPSAG